MDLHALEISKLFGDRRDEEMLGIYSALRRRPDGKSMGFIQVLGLSREEYGDFPGDPVRKSRIWAGTHW